MEAVINYEENGYKFDETSDAWKEMCTVLPCFKQVEWPDYPSEVREATINGKPVVIQLWKGWCQRFLGSDKFPGGIGAEVGVYERVSGRGFPSERPEHFPEALWTFLHEASKHANGDFWWPVTEMNEIEFDLVNPANGTIMFHAGPRKTYWMNKWMDTKSYHRWEETQGKRWPGLPAWVPFNTNTPFYSKDYVLQYKINGESFDSW